MDKTQIFIEKAIKVHGDKYDYSKVNYINAKTKIIIICKKHGEFEQTPDGHISGRKCKPCSIEIRSISKSNTETFIKKAKLIHGDKYDYSKVNYIKNSEKVIIICKYHEDFLQRPSGHLNGYGCQKCAIELSSTKQKSNEEEFIQKAKLIHGDKYDYSKVEYIKNSIKVIIICRDHGEFLQTPQGCLSGRGCQKCGYFSASTKQKSNEEEFIQKAKLIHGDKYDYSKVIYTTAINKIIIICKEHGEFNQIANSHLSNHGCQKCANINNSNSKKLNTEIFIKKAKLIHGDKYDYSKVEYIQNDKEVIIICKKHGESYQTPIYHFNGYGCHKCSKEISIKKMSSNTEEFIQKAKLKHDDKYDYSKVKYIKNSIKIIIICKKHGEFKQQPASHLAGNGCSRCSKQFSKPQIQWLELVSKLNNIDIQHAMNEGEFTIPTTRYKADGYCESTNTVYEFHGDYWHGNPNIFGANDMNKTCNITHGELYEQTLIKEQAIKDLGYNLVTMWEADWNRINNSIKKIQMKFRHR